MADIVSSLFGLSPMDTQQQIEQEDMRNALAIANLPQGKRAAYTGQLIGTKLARGLLGGFGIQDPRLQRATTIEEALKEVNDSLTDEEKANPFTLYTKVADTFAAKGLQQEAAMARAKAQESGLAYQGKLAEINKNLAAASKDTAAIGTEAFKALPQIEQLSVRAAQAKAAGNTTLANDLNAQISKLNEQANESIDNAITRLERVRETRALTTQEQASYDRLIALGERLNRAKAPKTTIQNMETDASGEVGKILREGRAAVKLAVRSLDTVNRLRKIVTSKDVFLGPGATVKQSLAQFSQVYLGAKNDKALADTRIALQGLADLALNARDRLEGTGSISDNEQRTIEKATTAGIDNLTKAELEVLIGVVEKGAKFTYDDYKEQWDTLEDPKLKRFYAPPPFPSLPSSGKTRVNLNKKPNEYTPEELRALQLELQQDYPQGN